MELSAQGADIKNPALTPVAVTLLTRDGRRLHGARRGHAAGLAGEWSVERRGVLRRTVRCELIASLTTTGRAVCNPCL